MTVCPSVSHVTLFVLVALFVSFVVGCGGEKADKQVLPVPGNDGKHRFLVLDPGHFHAALVFKRASYEGISPIVGLYAPVQSDFTDHMARVEPFNNRPVDPASWRYHIHLGPDFEQAMLDEKLGDIVVLSGRNDAKIGRLLASVRNGYNALVDKPWIIDPAAFDSVKTVLDEAQQRGLVAYDIMTERYEITSIVQRLLVADQNIFGTLTKGTPEEPAAFKSSVHHLSKIVAGQQLVRPWWFFDTSVQGEGLVDITTHLVDLMFWTLYPEKVIDYTTDIEMLNAKHWPTVMTPAEYATVTGQASFPAQFSLDADGNYPYYCNGNTTFRLNGACIKVEVIWNYMAPEGAGDTHYSIIRGTKANVLVLQGKEQNFRPEVYVDPAQGADPTELASALKAFAASLESGDYPGVSVVEESGRWRIDIPDSYRVGHEAHFGQVTDQFLAYLDGAPMPAWEKPNMLAKYFVTTSALKMCR